MKFLERRACRGGNGKRLANHFVFLWKLCFFLIGNICRAMRLGEDKAQDLLEEYMGPRYQVEKPTMVIDFITDLLSLLNV